MTDSAPHFERPSARRVALIAIALVLILIAGFAAGYLPRQRRERAVRAETGAAASALPIVNATRARLSEPVDVVELPGSIQAVMEAPVLARADGYLKRRSVDIGDHVTAGQVLAVPRSAVIDGGEDPLDHDRNGKEHPVAPAGCDGT